MALANQWHDVGNDRSFYCRIYALSHGEFHYSQRLEIKGDYDQAELEDL